MQVKIEGWAVEVWFGWGWRWWEGSIAYLFVLEMVCCGVNESINANDTIWDVMR